MYEDFFATLGADVLQSYIDKRSLVPPLSERIGMEELTELLTTFLAEPLAQRLIFEGRWHTLASETIQHLSKFLPGLDSNYIGPLADAFYQHYGTGSA